MAFRPIRPYHREELPSEPPKKHAAVYASPEKIREIVEVIRAEVPTFVPSQQNIEKIFDFLWKEDAVGGFSLSNVRVAVQALSYPIDKLERITPPAPPPPPPPVIEPEPVEILEDWQIPLHPVPSEWELRRASKEAIRDYLVRARAAK